METMIISDEVIGERRYIEACCGRTSALISVHETLGVRVTCKNAAASLTRFMGGRNFPSIDAAIAGYKSAEMRSILSYLAA